MTPTTLVECLLLLMQAGPLTPNALRLADVAIQAIACVPTQGRAIAEYGVDVLGVLEAVPLRHRKRLFWALDGGRDAGPSYYGYTREVNGVDTEWHWKLRKVRNHPNLGRDLFALLEENPCP
jgi:hypothetical protein